MRLLIKQYLTSLREREELDAILPDLLAQLGYEVQSRPKRRGPKQYGVDIWATGTSADGVKRVYLFSLKAGDLGRRDWNDGSVQSLKPSLDQMLSVFLRTHLPKHLRDLPVVVCVCCGGDIDETVRLELSCYQEQVIEQYPGRPISFEEWNGDTLTKLILEAFLREDLLPQTLRSNLRKALALVDEPQAAIRHFTALIEAIVATAADVKTRTLALRQMQICLWILYRWALEADNLEAPRHCAQLVTLRSWALGLESLEKKGKADQAVSGLVARAFDLLATITEAYVEKVEPACRVYHGVGMSVGSVTGLDVNLKLFELIGRLALHGIWLKYFLSRNANPTAPTTQILTAKITRVTTMLVSVIQGNPALQTPIKDSQALDINLACIFLMSEGAAENVRSWIHSIVGGVAFAFLHHLQYPSMISDYRALLRHPKDRTDAYRKKITSTSLLYPTLAVWAGLVGDHEASEMLATFAKDHLSHTHFELWFPDEESEDGLFGTSRRGHGMSNCDFKISADGSRPLRQVEREIELDDRLGVLSAAKYGLYPLILMACRFANMPSPPQYWLSFKAGAAEEDDKDVEAVGAVSEAEQMTG